jgi:hypothetical protein
MMTIPRAFAWTFWRQHGDGIRFQGIALILVAVLSAFVPRIESEWIRFAAQGILVAIVVLLTVPFTTALAMFTYGSDGADVQARESCFPPALFRLPVSTAWLAAWPMVAGAATVALLWIAAAVFLLQPWVAVLAPLGADDFRIPLWWPALLAAALLAWSQALMWHGFGLPWLRAVSFVLLLPIATATVVALVERLSEGVLCGLFAGCTVVGWGIAYLGVRRGRCGDTPDWSWLLLPVQRALRWRSRRTGTFATATRAQLWIEWRLGGYSLPFLVAFTLPFALWPLFFVRFLDAQTRSELGTDHVVPGLLALPVFLAGVFGSGGGGGFSPGVKSRKAGLGSFSAALPMTTCDMVAAMLKSAAISTLATWAIFAVLWPIAVGLAYDSAELGDGWRRALAEQGATKIASAFLAILTLAIVWTWKRQVDRLHFALTGREWVTTAIALTSIAVWVFVGVTAVLAIKNPSARVLIDATAPWFLGLVMMCRLLAAGWALRRVLRRGFVTWRTAACWLAVWLLVASLLIGVLVWSVPPVLVPVRYVVFAVLFAMPMARLVAAPLALDWNRHR